MTFKSLMNIGGIGGLGKGLHTPIERYHSDSGYHHDYHGGYKGNSKGGGSGAALSALTLLAFLFLINVMQQSLQENNSTTPQTTTTVLFRDESLPVILEGKEDKDSKNKESDVSMKSTYGAPPKSSMKNSVRVNN